MCTELLETVQFPLALKFTTSPELVVALTVKSASPKVLSARALNVIVWLALFTASVPFACPDSVASLELPGWTVKVVVPARVELAVFIVNVDVFTFSVDPRDKELGENVKLAPAGTGRVRFAVKAPVPLPRFTVTRNVTPPAVA